jgi:hypothetical protein
LPAAIPVNIPEEDPIVATAVLLLLQLPPGISVKTVVPPTQTLAVPVIGKGAFGTVTVVVV